jgi:hypothetical protein
MKTVRDACELQPNALSIKLGEQIEQLDELIHAEGDGTASFGRTSITQGMQDLVTEGIAPLAGVSTQAIFHLKQAKGVGKTHLLVGLGLLAKHPALRKKYCGSDANSQMFGEARVATDAACEGLNLQTLGTLINVDLPWNPSRREQRLGRIKRIGQAPRNDGPIRPPPPKGEGRLRDALQKNHRP